LRPQVERRVRFKPETAKQLEALAAKVFLQAGEAFDIDSPVALDRLLFEKLKLPRAAAAAGQPAAHAAASLASAPFKQAAGPDPLEHLRGKHALVPALLAYRKLEASEPRLAPRELYERVRSGELKGPVIRARARLQRGPTP